MPPIIVKSQQPKHQKQKTSPAPKQRKDVMPASHSSNRSVRFVKLWLPVLLCMGIIFIASSIPGNKIPPLFVFQDIAFHFMVYLILAWFFSRALKNTYSNISTTKIIFFSIMFGVIYGLSDEFHQTFVLGRTVSGFDVFIDSLGSIIGSLIYQWPR